MSADDLMEELGKARVVFWTCLNRAHKHVTWVDGVASCDTCGLTSTMARRWMDLIREDERKRTAQALRGVADSPELCRRLIARHPSLQGGLSLTAVLTALADEIENPSTREIGEADA